MALMETQADALVEMICEEIALAAKGRAFAAVGVAMPGMIKMEWWKSLRICRS